MMFIVAELMCCIQQRLSGLVVLRLAINKREIHMYFGVDKLGLGWGFWLYLAIAIFLFRIDN
jgi:hypothetical protein